MFELVINPVFNSLNDDAMENDTDDLSYRIIRLKPVFYTFICAPRSGAVMTVIGYNEDYFVAIFYYLI